MEFKKFGEVENSYRQKAVELIMNEIQMGRLKNDFIVNEKVHGSNFSFFCDGIDIKTGKKSGFVGADGENFFNSDIVKEKYKHNILNLFTHLQSGRWGQETKI